MAERPHPAVEPSFRFGLHQSRGKRRYVFTWNTSKFPMRAACCALQAAGAHHGEPEALPAQRSPGPSGIEARGGLCAMQRPANPVIDQFWDGWAPTLTSPAPKTGWW